MRRKEGGREGRRKGRKGRSGGYDQRPESRGKEERRDRRNPSDTQIHYLNKNILLDGIKGPELLFLGIVVTGRNGGNCQDSGQDGHALNPTLFRVLV